MFVDMGGGGLMKRLLIMLTLGGVSTKLNSFELKVGCVKYFLRKMFIFVIYLHM